MSQQRVMNRWLVVVGAILIQFCLGAIYAWSVFTKRITIPAADGGLYGFTAQQAVGIFSAGLATFAVVMVLAGRLQARIGPRPVAMAGGLILGTGYILGGFLGSTFWPQFLCIGLLGGAGIGMTYVVPITVGVKWFPDKKGLITGLAVAGFGFGAMLWIKLADKWFGGLLNTTNAFGLPGVQSVFVIYGITFLVCILLGSIVMVNPPAGYKPAGWEPPATTTRATGAVDLTSLEMLATPQFSMLWLMFLGSTLAGLMVIGVIKLFGTDALVAKAVVPTDTPAAMAAGIAAAVTAAGVVADTAAAWLAIFNGLGRIVWGMVSDLIGRKAALFLMCLFQGAVMFAFHKMGGSEWGLIAGASIIGFNFGGNFALFPAATADYFGNKNVGTNYGWVFLAYGVAGIAGPQLAGYFKDAASAATQTAAQAAGAGVHDPGAWFAPFVIAGVACFAAAFLALLLKAPSHKAG